MGPDALLQGGEAIVLNFNVLLVPSAPRLDCTVPHVLPPR